MTSDNTPKKVAIYIRVSTTYQVDKDSLPMQRKDLVAYSSLILGINDYDIFEDAGYSGKNTDRPGFQEMMSRVRKGEFSHVLVWKIDRISRNLLDFSEMFQELQKLHVTFVSKNEQFDTSTAMGEAMLKIILVFAELERNMTSERVTATMISRASSGIWNGSRVPFGYSYDKETATFSIREDEAAICRIIRDDYLENESITHTVKLLNNAGYITRRGASWSAAGVWKIIENPFNAGVYRYNYCGIDGKTRYLKPEKEWVLVPDHHPAIFTMEEHNAMLAIREKNSRHRNKIGQTKYMEHEHPFRGLLFCGSCGSRMVCSPTKERAAYGRSTTFTCPVHRRSKTCPNPSINESIVGEFVINYILNMLNAKTSFSGIHSPEELERRLLHGSTFDSILHIGTNGLHEFYHLLGRYRADNSYHLPIDKPEPDPDTDDPHLTSLRHEKDRQERALKRLQKLYLYSDDTMSEKDFIVQKAEITNRIEEINAQLGMMDASATTSLSDEDFVKMASHLLISSYLQDIEYIYYKRLASEVSPDILQEYLTAIIDSILVLDGRITSITFRNGLTHTFKYDSSKK